MPCPNCQKPLEGNSPKCPHCGVDAEVTLIGSAPVPRLIASDAGVVPLPGASASGDGSPSVISEAAAVPVPESSESASLADSPFTSSFDPYINQELDQKYRLVELLGSGSYGRVYRARWLSLESDVAVKILHPHLIDANIRKRFYREARAASKLSKHENIVRITDYVDGTATQSLVYIVMELLEGIPLNQILKDDRVIEPKRAVLLMSDICDGVGYAHSQDIIHRDLKPHNIVVLPAGSGRKSEAVKIVDFGLAKLLRTEGSVTSSITLVGMTFGTPLYMSPEAWRGDPLDARSDIYSLGATMYHMLGGRPPFQSNNILQLQRLHENELPPPIAPDNARLKALEDVIMRALEKDPDKRQQTAREFADELSAAIDDSPLPIPLTITPPLIRFPFEVAQLDIHGKVVERSPKHARSFTEKIDSESIEMVEIPSGEFAMGSPDSETGRRKDEGPQRKVTISQFFMSKYEITQAQWRDVAFLDKVDRELDPTPSNVRGDKKPVEGVSWYDAVEFCARLSRHTGRQYRLPSEAEWEYACRAGVQEPFCFGHNINWELVNHNGNFPYAGAAKGHFRSTTTDVGSVGGANNFGLYDVLGNVWEWCQDEYHRTYDGAPSDGTPRLADGELPRVIRGGSWRAAAVDCGSAARNNDLPQTCKDDVGFRVVCSLTGQTTTINDTPPPLTFIQRLKRAVHKFGARTPKRLRLPLELDVISPSKQIDIFLFLPLTHLLLALFTLNLFVPQILPNILDSVLWGLVMGMAQAFILRRYLASRLWWILVTTVAAGVSGLLYDWINLPWTLSWSYVWGSAGIYPFLDRSVTIVVMVALRWCIIGLAQWLLLRKFAARTALWPILTTAGAILCGLVVVSFGRDVHRDTVFLTYTFSAGILLGLLQCLCILNFRNKAHARA